MKAALAWISALVLVMLLCIASCCHCPKDGKGTKPKPTTTCTDGKCVVPAPTTTAKG